jgi:hypothetical protein
VGSLEAAMKELTGLRKKDVETGAKQERKKIIRYLSRYRDDLERCLAAADIRDKEHLK